MPDRPSRRFFFDTVTLANFALGGRFGLLADRNGTCHFPAARFVDLRRIPGIPASIRLLSGVGSW